MKAIYALIPPKAKAIIALGIVLVIIGAVAGVKGYGAAKYKDGKTDGKLLCRAEHAETILKEADKAVKTRERIEHETARMSDADVDADLVRLGIMRNSEDR